MAAIHLDCAPASWQASRLAGLGRKSAAMGGLIVLALYATGTWRARRSQRTRYEDRVRALNHRLDIAQGAATSAFAKGFAVGVEASRLEIQASAEGPGAVAAVIALRPKRRAPMRSTSGRRLDSGA